MCYVLYKTAFNKQNRFQDSRIRSFSTSLVKVQSIWQMVWPLARRCGLPASMA